MEHKEAIEIVKKNYPHVGFSGSQFETALRVIVPELAESEDEKIRKELFFFLQEINETKGVPERFFVWLEKQKELWTPSKEVMDVLFALAYITNEVDDQKDDVITRLYQDLKREFFNGASYENMFPKEERQKEQKPAEWSEEDDYRIRWIISLLTTMREKGVDDRFGDSVFDDIPDMIAWLKSIRPQSKQEWTEKKNALLEWCMKKAEEYRQMDADFDGNVFIGNRHGILEVVEKIKEL